MTAVLAEEAREALRLADIDPGRCVELASAVIRQATAERNVVALAVAERALGLAAAHSDDLETALRHLRRAVRIGQQSGVRQVAGEARMTLAMALNRRGRTRQALREIDSAVLDLAGVEHARAMAQRGAILLQLGRLDEALVSWRVALPALRRARDKLWTLRVLNNRGLVHGHRRELAAAETDLVEADRLARTLGLGLTAAHIEQNLGWVNALRGDVPAALHHLDLAERRLRELKAHTGTLLSDRSELLLSVRLVSEAKEAAEQSVQAFEREHRHDALPEARLLLAQAATLDGDPVLALQQARRAVREFGQQQRLRWITLARFLALTSAPSAPTVGQLRTAADDLDAAGWSAAALEARLLSARYALDRGLTRQGCEQLERASRARSHGPARLRARGWHAEALLRLARGNHRAATTAVRAGLRVLDEHRATIGATDLRAYSAGHRTELAELGLRMALADGRRGRVLAWAEQSRASHLLMRPVSPPDDPVLARALAELRATVMEINDVRGAGGSTAKLVQRQVTLERKIRDHCRLSPGDATANAVDPVPQQQLAAALGESALVEFIQLDDVLRAITLVDGRITVTVLGRVPDVSDLVDRLPFALHRLVRHHATADSRSAAMTMLRHAAARFDAMLLRPLHDRIGDRPLVLVPTGPLQSVPWSILPSCAGRPVTVSPSAALWHVATHRPGPSNVDVAVAVGPGLPTGRTEAEAVAAIHGTKPLVDAAATVEAVTAALGTASVMHLAAHGRFHVQNPLFSSLMLADGPLTVYDLERLDRVPTMVVLAACDSGRSVVCAGDELLGMSASFLAHGAQQLVASVVPVPDAETGPLMVEFHRLLVAGLPAPEALARAQQEVTGDEAVIAAAAGFVCIGGQFTLRPAERQLVGSSRAGG